MDLSMPQVLAKIYAKEAAMDDNNFLLRARCKKRWLPRSRENQNKHTHTWPSGQYWVFKKKKKERSKIEAQYSCIYFARKWALASELKKTIITLRNLQQVIFKEKIVLFILDKKPQSKVEWRQQAPTGIVNTFWRKET